MAVRSTVEESASANHSVRVNWFQREPGGGTIFVRPEGDGAAPQPVAEHDQKAGAAHGSGFVLNAMYVVVVLSRWLYSFNAACVEQRTTSHTRYRAAAPS